jgi:hypothetical protein
MQISWVEKLAADGIISERAMIKIYADCGEILKTAMDPAKVDAFLAKGEQFFGNAAGSLAGSFAGLGAGALFEHAEDKVKQRMLVTGTMKAITENRDHILGHADFAMDKDKAQARFVELAELAPLVAANRALSMRLVKAKLHGGFTDQDVMSLAMMQASYADPKLKAALGREKMASAVVNVTAACRLGEMYADALTMVKEAASVAQVGAATKRMLGAHLTVAAIPLMVAAGAGAFNVAMSGRNAEAMAKRHRETFEAAMKMANPDTSPLHNDRAKALQAFQSLVHFAPHVATEPNAARAFMEKIVSYDMGIQTADVRDLTDIERNIGQAGGPSPFMAGFTSGAASMGLGGHLVENVKQFNREIMPSLHPRP